MIDREVYWDSVWSDPETKNSLVLDHRYVKAQELDEGTFEPIRQVIYELFANTLDSENPLPAVTRADQKKILDQLNQTTSISYPHQVLSNLDLMVRLDILLAQLSRDKGMMNGIEGIQFPVTVRIVHPEPPEGMAERPYMTDNIHCDPWIGAPPDMIQGLIYVEIDAESSEFELYDVDRERLQKISLHRGATTEDFARARPLIEDLKPVGYAPRPGLMFAFDTFTPHRTVRKGNNVRLSIDYRLRREDPYKTLDERWNTGNSGWDLYWYLNFGEATTFEERCALELERLQKAGNLEGVARRQESIKALKQHMKVAS